MDKPKQRTFMSGNIAVISEDEFHWTSYYFTVCGIEYFLANTFEDPYWELMIDDQDVQEYIRVAVGASAVHEWLMFHNMPGII